MKTLVNKLNGVNLLTLAISVIGLAYVIYSLYCVWHFGSVVPFGIFHDLVLGGVTGGITIASAKGAKDVKAVPFTVSDTTTKGGKAAFLVLFDKDERGAKALDHITDIALLSGVPFFAWPSKNVDKDKYVAKGMMNNPASLHILENFEKMTYLTAKELKVKNQEDKAASREAKKADKAANKGGATAVIAKIQAYKDLHKEGLITLDVMLAKIAELE